MREEGCIMNQTNEKPELTYAESWICAESHQWMYRNILDLDVCRVCTVGPMT